MPSNENSKKLNRVLLVVILILVVAIITFNWGYQLGEHKGYVEGMQWCVEKGGSMRGQTANPEPAGSNTVEFTHWLAPFRTSNQ
jgi:hypothetical protein